MDCLLSVLDWFTFGDEVFYLILGAVLTFFVSRMNDRFGRRREEKESNRNALKRLIIILNEIMDIISSNRYSSHHTGTIGQDDTALHLTWESPYELPIDPTITFYLQRPSLINEVFSYTILCRKLNSDQNTVYDTYYAMRDCKLRKDIEREQYVASFKEFQSYQKELIKGYNMMMQETISLQAHARFAQTWDRKFLVTKLVSRYLLCQRDQEEIKEERKLVEAEMECVMKEGRKKLKQFGFNPPNPDSQDNA